MKYLHKDSSRSILEKERKKERKKFYAKIYYLPGLRSSVLQNTVLKVNFREITSTYGDSERKESTCRAGDLGSIPGLGRSPGEGNGYPVQYSFLEIPTDRRAWQVIVHGVAKSWT